MLVVACVAMLAVVVAPHAVSASDEIPDAGAPPGGDPTTPTTEGPPIPAEPPVPAEPPPAPPTPDTSAPDPADGPLSPVLEPGTTDSTALTGDGFEPVEEGPEGIDIVEYYASQPAFDAGYYNRVLDAELARARRDLAASEARQRAAEARVAEARERHEAARAAWAGLDDDHQALLAEAAEARRTFERRVRAAYIRGRDLESHLVVRARDAGDYAIGMRMLGSVAAHDRLSLEQLVERFAGLDDEDRRRTDVVVRADADLEAARTEMLAASWERLAAVERVRMYEAGSHVAVDGFVFPVQAAPGDVEFIDSFGAPRNVGTRYEHWHEGTDIMAPHGTPLVAVEAGVIERAATNTLGGISLRIRGRSGYAYYYAHLAAYAPGIEAGVAVEAGDLVGFVGDTGDARGGAPHLHFELRLPDGRTVVNPYPILRVSWDAQQRAAQSAGQLTPVPPRPQ